MTFPCEFFSRMTERHVQALWYDAALRPALIRTERGGVVRILDPGTWNTGPGPDFLGAVFDVGRANAEKTEKWDRKTGDVEVHMRPGDWTAHGHADDAAYRNVAAHVTWFGGPPPATLPRGCVSVHLGESVRQRGGFVPEAVDVKAYPYARLPSTERPCARFLARDPDLAAEVLRAAGVRRLRAKAARFAERMLEVGDAEQAFYEETFAAMGYAAHKEAFRALARRMRRADLPVTPTGAYEALHAMDALEDCFGNVARQGRRAREDGARYAAIRPARGRPANAPAGRLADAAAFFAGGKPAHLGPGRAAALLANVIVPFALARGAIFDVPGWLPPEDVSGPVRLTAFRLLGRDHNPALYARDDILIQGLLQIYREFCLVAHPDCDRCALAAHLSRMHAREREVADDGKLG